MVRILRGVGDSRTSWRSVECNKVGLHVHLDCNNNARGLNPNGENKNWVPTGIASVPSRNHPSINWCTGNSVLKYSPHAGVPGVSAGRCTSKRRVPLLWSEATEYFIPSRDAPFNWAKSPQRTSCRLKYRRLRRITKENSNKASPMP